MVTLNSQEIMSEWEWHTQTPWQSTIDNLLKLESEQDGNMTVKAIGGEYQKSCSVFEEWLDMF